MAKTCVNLLHGCNDAYFLTRPILFQLERGHISDRDRPATGLRPCHGGRLPVRCGSSPHAIGLAPNRLLVAEGQSRWCQFYPGLPDRANGGAGELLVLAVVLSGLGFGLRSGLGSGIGLNWMKLAKAATHAAQWF